MAEARAMRSGGRLARLRALQERFAEALAVVGMLVIVALMLLVVADVVLRAALGTPLGGTVDYVSTGLGAAIALAMPYAFLADLHIRVPVLVDALPRAPRRAVAVLSTLVSATFLTLLTRQSWIFALERRASGERMMIAGWETWPVWAAIAALFTLTSVALWTLFAAVVAGEAREPERPGGTT